MKRAIGGLLLAMLASGEAWATCGGGGGGGRGGIAPAGGGAPQVYNVPWKVWGPDTPAATEGLILYWFPASPDELKLSELRVSRPLSLYASQCLALLVVPPGAGPIAQRYDVASKLPLLVLAQAADGTEIARVAGSKGALPVADAEKLVRDTYKQREDAAQQKLDEAKLKQKTGDGAAAIALLREVWAERCLLPKKAKDAGKELKKLGEPVAERSALDALEPIFDGPVAKEVAEAMQKGLDAEEAARYEDARGLYQRAHALDPADPAPLRYLAELLRHHTGEWAAARRTFDDLLAMPADPLSRAVAQHGLGKMTIHEGRFADGLALLEASVRSYPLALAYRNLAVYWNSEGAPQKADGYVQQALALDPTDPYNLVFAATYLAAGQGRAEALRIASENRGLLPASYNLAAIHALLGHRDEALALLRRHFYEYERYEAVRIHEMKEARVDAVFLSLRKDEGFLELTRLADAAGAGGMR